MASFGYLNLPDHRSSQPDPAHRPPPLEQLKAWIIGRQKDRRKYNGSCLLYCYMLIHFADMNPTLRKYQLIRSVFENPKLFVLVDLSKSQKQNWELAHLCRSRRSLFAWNW